MRSVAICLLAIVLGLPAMGRCEDAKKCCADSGSSCQMCKATCSACPNDQRIDNAGRPAVENNRLNKAIHQSVFALYAVCTALKKLLPRCTSPSLLH